MSYSESRNLACAAAAAAAISLAVGVGEARSQPEQPAATMGKNVHHHPYIGMWVTSDGHVRQELLPNGRYDEARGSRKSAYQGRYEVTGTRIEYWDDTGFTADGEFIDDVLHHGGMIFYRNRK
jgi:hypothetical protein